MFKSLNFKVILFGFIFTFFSSFGQSFFLGLFNPSIRETLSITHGQFGSIYASATLLSSFVLVLIGRKIDDMKILKFASYVIVLLAISSFVSSNLHLIVSTEGRQTAATAKESAPTPQGGFVTGKPASRIAIPNRTTNYVPVWEQLV